MRLCLMRYGVGRWREIQECGLLPGKTIQQLSGQTQRLLGQQALIEFTGLCVDVDRVRADNDVKIIDPSTGEPYLRKAGLLIHAGSNKRDRASLQAAAQAKYGLSSEHIEKVQQQMESIADKLRLQLRLPADSAKPSEQGTEKVPEEATSREGCGAPPAAAAGAAAAASGGQDAISLEDKTLYAVDLYLLEVDESTLDKEGQRDLLRRLNEANAEVEARIEAARAARQQKAAAQQLAGQQQRQRQLEARKVHQEAQARLPPTAAAASGAATAGQPHRKAGGNGMANGSTKRGRGGTAKGSARRGTGGRAGRARRGGGGGGSNSEDDDGEGDLCAAVPVSRAAREAQEAALAHDIANLEAMGFDRKKAREALEETNCDPDAAIEYLLKYST